MKLMHRIAALIAAAALSAGALVNVAQAQTYPAKPIRLIVPYPPGGGTDVVARLFATRMGAVLGQAVFVENIAGASGKIGMDAFRRNGRPDGYTLMLAGSVTHSILPVTTSLEYDPNAVFTPVGLLAAYALTLVVNPALPIRDMGQLVAHARANPGKLTFGSAGTGSGTHLIFEAIIKQAGIDILHVPYKGSGPSLQAVIGGEVSLTLNGDVSSLVSAGTVRPLAVAGVKRDPRMPGVPTMGEVGLPSLELDAWNGLIAPPDTPAPIVQRLNQAIQEALKDEAFARSLQERGLVSEAGPPAQLTARAKQQLALYARVASSAGIAGKQ